MATKHRSELGGAAGRSALNRAIEDYACELQEHCKGAIAPSHGLRTDRKFGQLLALLTPRIRRAARQYGLGDMMDDAEQVGAIAVYRALGSFDPAKASFSTHATWQIRGEMQGLRHRMRLDQRRSARSAGVSTVSLDALRTEESDAPFEIADDAALVRTEEGASCNMVHRMMEQLLDRVGSPEEERVIMFDTVYDREPDQQARMARTSEQRRQIVRRTWRNCIKVLAA